MATYYVSSVDGNNATPPSVTWWNGNQTTYATVTGALVVATADGDIIYVDSAHAHTAGAAITWLSAGVFIAVISVNRTTGAWAAGASELVGAASVAFSIGNNATISKFFIYGMTLACGSTNSSSCLFNVATGASNTAQVVHFDSCSLSTPSTSAASRFLVGRSNASGEIHQVSFKSCNLVAHDNVSGELMRVQGATVVWNGSTVSYAGANNPGNAMFVFLAGCSSQLFIHDSDLSGWVSGAYFDVTGFNGGAASVVNCKLHGTPTLLAGSGTFPSIGSSLTLVNVDSADTRSVFWYRTRAGTLTVNASIYATNGAQFDGVGLSWEIVTTANCSEFEPFVTPWIHLWCDDTSSITASLEVNQDNGTDLHNRNAWPEFEYVSSSAFPLGTMNTGRHANPFTGTAVDWTNSGEGWTGTGGFVAANPQTLDRTFTPAEKSLLRGRLYVGVASRTLYLDPNLRVA